MIHRRRGGAHPKNDQLSERFSFSGFEVGEETVGEVGEGVPGPPGGGTKEKG